MEISQHDHVVKVYQADVADDVLSIRMEYHERGNVEDAFRGEPLPVGTAIDVMTDALRGLEHLHTRGVAHRDLKPSNILLGLDGRSRLSDFGLATLLEETSIVPRFYLPHTAPEQLRSLDFSGTVLADVYAAGVTMYRLLNGERVFLDAMNSQTDLPRSIQSGRFPNRERWLPHIHRPLVLATRRAMNKVPENRFATSVAFRLALDKARPKIAWSMRPTGNGAEWAGRVGNEEKWLASLSRSRSDLYDFVLQKRSTSGYRQQRSAGLLQATPAEAFAHATRVLGLVAATGSWP